jgi:3-keto-5-aminohexanoate cleavage enzyme
LEKLIIEAAINEQASKDANPHVPYSVEECVEDAIRCADAGAAIVHFHARDAKSGDLLSPGTEVYRDAMRLILRDRPELLLYPTYTPADRFVHVEALATDPEVRLRVATIDPGAMNFSSFDPSTNQIRGDLPFVLSHADCARFFEICARQGIRYSVVVREPGQVRIAVAYHRAGLIAGKMFFKLNLADSMLFGLPPSPEAAQTYMSLVPGDIPYSWMNYIYGPSHWAMTRYAITAGGHVRTGLGDNPVEPDGSKPTNEELVRRVSELADELGRNLATPKEAVAIFDRV